MGKITYKVSVTATKGRDKGQKNIVEKTGDVVWLTLAGQRIKFAFQDIEGDGQRPLVHVPTGGIAVKAETISAIKLAFYVSSGGVRLREREVAEDWLINRIQTIGAEKFLAILASQPILNP